MATEETTENTLPSCRCCGGDLGLEHELLPAGTFHTCRRCGSLQQLRTSIPDDRYNDEYLPDVDLEQHWIWSRRYLEWATEELAPGRALEIAPGHCCLLKLLADAGWKVHGVDLCPRSVEWAEKWGLPPGTVELTDFFQWQPPIRWGVPLAERDEAPVTQEYDLVVATHFLEHFSDPRDVIADLAQHVAPGGRLFVHTPNPFMFTGAGWVHVHDVHLTMPSPPALMGMLPVGFARLEAGQFSDDQWMLMERQ